MDVRLACFALLASVALAGCGAPDAPAVPSGRIDGALVDHMLRPWPDAAVHLVELDVWTRTTELGGFSFMGVPPGLYTLEASIVDIGMDRELVIVEDDVTRVILQVFKLPDPEPYISQLTHPAHVQIAEPGERCEDCHWSALFKSEAPQAVTVLAMWDPVLAPGFETHVILELTDQDGQRLLDPMDRRDETRQDELSVLCFRIPGADLPDSVRQVVMDVTFDADNPLPHIDFRIDTFLFIQYGPADDPATC